MRPLFPALLGLLTACGGNFSNEDLEYLNALPTREELASKLPDSAAFSGRRGERLSVGEPSPLYQDTRQASDNFNTLLDELLTLVETIRALPPTTREPHRRTWGPFTDTNQPGHEARFVMERQEDANVFTYQFQFKPIQADDSEWWSFLAGAFRADAGVRKGEGELHLFVGEAVAKGLHVEGLHPLQQLDVVYQTRELPTRVEMRLIAQSPSAPAEVRYTYRELPGGWGEMRFIQRDTEAVPGGQKEDVEITSRWTPAQGGVGTFIILRGDLTGAGYRECWNPQYEVTYAKRSWELFGTGDVSTCPDVSGFEG
ncbi:hypothetical protein [Stigmatella aurantiaca]|uniref:Lipoprotein n=1 Tax=Stigmatella aurantiaca (strain DW4/3-1) TaxID=378806 RepID=E3FUC2_STIAD|nr:hypothetical protein [Stigmatella aurantiaca]ADO73441.1 uncharacterized protein STAUR_5678 [Stigmatella aurantiaca DW4/3-1]